MKNERNVDKLRQVLSSNMEKGIAVGQAQYGDLMSSAEQAFQAAHRRAMPEMRKALLANALDQYATHLKQRNVPQAFIKEAVENIQDVDNPIAMMFAMITALVPNFSYLDVAATQPMPTEESPFFFQQLTAVTARNGVAANTKLLGEKSWEASNLYTGNRNREDIGTAGAVGGAAWAITLAMKPVLPGTVRVKSAAGSILLKDDGAGGFVVAKGTCTLGAASINYTTGAVSIVTSVGDLDSAMVDYRFDMDAYDPVQVKYEWASKQIKAHPKRIRTIYGLDNYYAAKQVIKMDIDSLMSDAVMGWVNKEISGGVYEDMLDEADSETTWSKTLPSGVSWAMHRFSILESLTTASNAIRKGIKRGGGNVLVLSTDWMNIIETLGNDLWKPASYNREPIGPYTAGVLADKYTVVKNQEFPDDTGFMAYKADDTDAAFAVGVFIPMYDTDPYTLDDLKVRRGIGTSMGSAPIIEGGIRGLRVTA